MLHFYKGEIGAAEKIFTAMAAGKSTIAFAGFLQSLADEARYKELQIYLNYLLKRKEEVRLYQAICQSALFDVKSSEGLLAGFLPANEDEVKIVKLLRATNQTLLGERIDCVVDTNGQPLAYYDLTQKKNNFHHSGDNF